MLTSDELVSRWQELEAETGPAPGQFKWVPCSPGCPDFLRAGLLDAGPERTPLRLLLLRLPHKLAVQLRPDQRYQGLRVEPLATTTGPAGEAYIALILELPGLRDIFGVLAADVAQAAAAQSTDGNRMRTFLGRLERWEALLQAFRADGLSFAAQQGLFGELYVLRELLHNGINPDAALAAWAGPMASVHDFILPGQTAAEVKTLGPNVVTARISNAAQLDDSPLARLWLVLVQLADAGTAPASGTLPALVADLAARLAPQPHAAALLTQRLHQAGYFDTQAHMYTGLWAVDKVRLLAVRDDFPRLQAAHLPAALSAVTYSLDTSALTRFEVAFTELAGAF